MDGNVGSSSGHRRRADVLAAFDPRRSLVARVLWLLAPIVLVPFLVFWVAAERLGRRTEGKLTERIVAAAVAEKRGALRVAADRRLQTLAARSEEVVAVLREAAGAVRRALESGPAPELPAEPIEELPGGGLRSVGNRRSAALVSRAAGPAAQVSRDLAATRRLEERFSDLMAGHAAISAIYVLTRSGVLRAVPWRDARDVFGAGALAPDFRLEGRQLGWPAAEETVPAVHWVPPYPDLYGRRGRIVTARVALASPSGEVAAEVGVDWALEELFTRTAEPLEAGEVEVVLDPDGKALFAVPAAVLEADGRRLAALAASQERVDALVDLAGGPHLVSLRRTVHAGWTYARLLPLSRVRSRVLVEVAPIREESRQLRSRLRQLYLVLSFALAVALGLVLRRTLSPLRRLARVADGMIAPAPSAPAEAELSRRDELGRLARALSNLGGRVRRRMRSMEGVHELALSASVVTRPDEAYARLSRSIGSLVGATKAWLALWEPESRSLAFAPPGWGVPDDALSGVRIGVSDRSLAALAYRTGETYVCNDVPGDPQASRQLAERTGVAHNAVFAPLKTEVGTLGVLIVAEKEGGFDEEDRAAVEGYADQAALLLRNARLYEELQKSYEKLRDATRNRDHFLQNINHELRTPLTAILGWSEVLAEDRPGPHTVETAIEQIRRSAQFLLTLISDLLDLARFEEGRTRLERVPVDLGTLAREAVEPVAVMAEAKGILLSVTAPASGEASVVLDPVRIRQVLWNLVHNAVKFTPKGGRIDLEARAADGGCWFRVRDDGVGISPKDLPHVFERFRQGDGSTTRDHRGTGIGLALAKAFVELHGGRIEVRSAPGCGTTFDLFLPSRGPVSSGSVSRVKRPVEPPLGGPNGAE